MSPGLVPDGTMTIRRCLACHHPQHWYEAAGCTSCGRRRRCKRDVGSAFGPEETIPTFPCVAPKAEGGGRW
jgi:hypothetical protein